MSLSIYGPGFYPSFQLPRATRSIDESSNTKKYKLTLNAKRTNRSLEPIQVSSRAQIDIGHTHILVGANYSLANDLLSIMRLEWLTQEPFDKLPILAVRALNTRSTRLQGTDRRTIGYSKKPYVSLMKIDGSLKLFTFSATGQSLEIPKWDKRDSLTQHPVVELDSSESVYAEMPDQERFFLLKFEQDNNGKVVLLNPEDQGSLRAAMAFQTNRPAAVLIQADTAQQLVDQQIADRTVSANEDNPTKVTLPKNNFYRRELTVSKVRVPISGKKPPRQSPPSLSLIDFVNEVPAGLSIELPLQDDGKPILKFEQKRPNLINRFCTTEGIPVDYMRRKSYRDDTVWAYWAYANDSSEDKAITLPFNTPVSIYFNTFALVVKIVKQDLGDFDQEIYMTAHTKRVDVACLNIPILGFEGEGIVTMTQRGLSLEDGRQIQWRNPSSQDVPLFSLPMNLGIGDASKVNLYLPIYSIKSGDPQEPGSLFPQQINPEDYILLKVGCNKTAKGNLYFASPLTDEDIDVLDPMQIRSKNIFKVTKRLGDNGEAVFFENDTLRGFYYPAMRANPFVVFERFHEFNNGDRIAIGNVIGSNDTNNTKTIDFKVFTVPPFNILSSNGKLTIFRRKSLEDTMNSLDIRITPADISADEVRVLSMSKGGLRQCEIKEGDIISYGNLSHQRQILLVDEILDNGQFTIEKLN